MALSTEGSTMGATDLIGFLTAGKTAFDIFKGIRDELPKGQPLRQRIPKIMPRRGMIPIELVISRQ
jgi:hypothetical protein